LQRIIIAACIAALVSLFGGSAAFARPAVSLKLQADLVQHDDKGTEKLVPIVDDAGLKPGDIVRYVIVAANSGSDPATHLVPQGKIPSGTAYEAGSASKSDALHVEFSLDGGKTWSAKPTVKVQTSAGLVLKPADPSSFTTLRWIGAQPLLPKTSQTYSYQVRIK
jgi:uncharacterized repeat protein (TIGR01451 family)